VKTLVTGASGFVGAAVCRQLISESKNFLPVHRNDHQLGSAMGSICGSTDWSNALKEISHVIHTAARVHVMKEKDTDSLSKFRKVNVEGTLNLARQCAESGVKRFIFISSIKVNGEQTSNGMAFTEKDEPEPCDPYAVSKYEAEEGLRNMALKTGMEVVVIRPPLIYGPRVKANFLSLMKLVKAGFPLPLGGVDNKRSMVSLNNIVDIIVTCLTHSKAGNQTFLVSDGEDLSVTQLLKRLASAMDVPSRLITVPSPCLQFGLRIIGKQSIADRLLGSLQIDNTKIKTLLNWSPILNVDEGLSKTVKFFIGNSQK
jgi:nucleoside-diphosphate-sugar epimerase